MTLAALALPSSALVGTLAALCGSAVGGLVPLLSNVILQKGLTQREVLNHQIAGLESLYSDFILEASRLLNHAMFNSLPEADKVLSVYTLVARIRLNSSKPVIDAAEHLVTRIIGQYAEPNMTVEAMRNAVLTSRADRMDEFTEACRTELFDVFKRGGALAR